MDGPTSGAPSFCPECGTELDLHANFCPGCGNAVRDSPTAAYCRTCGTEFDDTDEFCSNCGTARDPSEGRGGEPSSPGATGEATGMEDRSGTDSSDEFRNRVNGYLSEGWDVESDYGDSVVLVDRGIGNVGVHFLLLFLTGGLGNVVYGWYCYDSNADRIRLSVDDPDPTPQSASGSDDGIDVAEWAGGGLLASIGVLISVAAGLNPVGLAFLLVGLLVFPPTRDRITRRKSLTRFGSVQSTDERVVENPEKPCVVCGRPIDRGVERSYREETVVAGFPVYTSESGENHYCQECAADPAVSHGETGDADDGSTATWEMTTDEELEFDRN